MHTNEIVRGAVKSLAISRSTGQVVCHGGNQGHVDVKLVDLASGRVAETLEQIADIEVSSISLSPNGRLITFKLSSPLLCFSKQKSQQKLTTHLV